MVSEKHEVRPEIISCIKILTVLFVGDFFFVCEILLEFVLNSFRICTCVFLIGMHYIIIFDLHVTYLRYFFYFQERCIEKLLF